MNSLNANYERILEVLRKISKEQLLTYQKRQAKLSDLELISLSLTTKFMGIYSENDLFRKLPKTLSSKIERSVYNKRRRKLAGNLNSTRLKLASALNAFENYFIVDSMSLKACKLSKISRSKICIEDAYAFPDKGFCAPQNSNQYGNKLHAVCSVNGVFQSIDLSPASVCNIYYIKDTKMQISDCTLFGDRGYLSAKIQLKLFETYNIKLNTPMRNIQKDYKKQPFVFRKKRKRIETLFSQLCDQFMIRRNYTKTFEGFQTRILSKITTLTVIHYLNKNIFGRNINNVKIGNI